MSRLFGPVRQMGHVVRDLDRSLRYWIDTLGVGPFYVVRGLPIEKFWYKGQPSPAPHLTLAIAQSGDLQVELIHQSDSSPSAFLDSLRDHGEGLQHVSSWVSQSGYDTEVARLRGAGVAVAHEGWMPDAGPRFAFFAVDGAPGGFQFEVSDVGDPKFSALGTTIREASIGWVGTDPIRDLVI